MVNYYSLGRIYSRDATRKEERKHIHRNVGLRRNMTVPAIVQLTGRCKATFVAKVARKIYPPAPSTVTAKITAKGKILRKATAIISSKCKITATAKVVRKTNVIAKSQSKITATAKVVRKTNVIAKSQSKITANGIKFLKANTLIGVNSIISANAKINNQNTVFLTLSSKSKITANGIKSLKANALISGTSRVAVSGKKVIRGTSNVVVLAAIVPRASRLIRGESVIIAARTTNKVKAEATALWKSCELHFYSI